MFYNLKYRAWKRVNDWWQSKKPVCKHWFKVVSPMSGRHQIEVRQCFWCPQLSTEVYINGVPADYHEKGLAGYGPEELYPVMDEPPVELERTDPKIVLPNGEEMYERRFSVDQPDRDAGKSTKTPRPRRRVKQSAARSKHRS